MTTQDSSGDSPSRYDAVIASDRQNVWHHLTQHKMLENNDPMVIGANYPTEVGVVADLQLSLAAVNAYLDARAGD